MGWGPGDWGVRVFPEAKFKKEWTSVLSDPGIPGDRSMGPSLCHSNTFVKKAVQAMQAMQVMQVIQVMKITQDIHIIESIQRM